MRRRTQRLNLTDPVVWEHPLNVGLVSWCIGPPGRSPGRILFDLCRRNDGSYAAAGPPLWTPGKSLGDGRCIEYIAAGSDNVSFGDKPSLRLTRFTLSAWVRPFSFSNTQVIVTRANASSLVRNYNWDVQATGTMRLYYTNGSGSFNGLDPSTITLSTGVWQFGTASYDGAALRMWVNGVAAGSVASSNTPDTVLDTMSTAIGQMGSSATAFFDGTIDDVRIYDYGFSTTGMADALYRESLAGHPNTLRRQRPTHFVQAAAPAAGQVPYDLAHTPKHQAVMAM